MTTPRPVLSPLDLSLSISASFFASGFIAWGLLQTKELIMLIANWIRKQTAKSVEKRLNEARREAFRESYMEAYKQGYADGLAGKPKQPPGDDPGKSS